MPETAVRLKGKTDSTAENSADTSSTPMEVGSQGSGQRLDWNYQQHDSHQLGGSAAAGGWLNSAGERTHWKSTEKKADGIVLVS